jgi:hypothetical protein
MTLDISAIVIKEENSVENKNYFEDGIRSCID